MSLERIIRPFQAGDVFTARGTMPTLPASGLTISTDVPLLQWTAENPAKYEEIPDDMQVFGFTVKWEEDKAQRVTEEVRVEQPDNPENYVVVERVQSATMTNSQTGETFRMAFKDWDKERK